MTASSVLKKQAPPCETVSAAGQRRSVTAVSLAEDKGTCTYLTHARLELQICSMDL